MQAARVPSLSATKNADLADRHEAERNALRADIRTSAYILSCALEADLERSVAVKLALLGLTVPPAMIAVARARLIEEHHAERLELRRRMHSDEQQRLHHALGALIARQQEELKRQQQDRVHPRFFSSVAGIEQRGCFSQVLIEHFGWAARCVTQPPTCHRPRRQRGRHVRAFRRKNSRSI